MKDIFASDGCRTNGNAKAGTERCEIAGGLSMLQGFVRLFIYLIYIGWR